MLNSPWIIPFSPQKRLKSRRYFKPQFTGGKTKAQERLGLKLKRSGLRVLQLSVDGAWTESGGLAPDLVPPVTALQRTHCFSLGHTTSSKGNISKDF